MSEMALQRAQAGRDGQQGRHGRAAGEPGACLGTQAVVAGVQPRDAGSSVVVAEDLHVVFAQGGTAVHAVRGLDLAVGRGEFLALEGASGCGKSTLLHVIGGLLRPTSGRVRVEQVDLSASSENERDELRRRRIGFVFQRFHLFPSLSIAANLRLAVWVRGRGRAERAMLAARIPPLLAELGLDHRAGHRPCALSGGEQQRVAVARALLNQPTLLLADEPTGNLDSANSRRVLELLAERNRTTGQTIVMITHDAEAASYATRRLRMRDGRIHA